MSIRAALLLTLVCSAAATAASPAVFVARPTSVTALVDLNADGDFLDFGEATIYASGLPTGISAIAVAGSRMFVAEGVNIWSLVDLNGDGDALDFGEITLYAQLSGTTPALTGLVAASDERCFSVDTTSGSLYRFEDLNHDGDALDAGEVQVVGSGLAGAVSLAARPDGVMLLAQSSNTIPVLILRDRTGDGDFADFAEIISYVENTAAGTSIAAATDRIAYLARPADGRVLQMNDLTGDDDALDFGELRTWAEGLSAPSRIALEQSGDLLVACADAAGSIYRLHDANADGDAMDFGETLLVAEAMTQVRGIAVRRTTGCLPGDLNGDGRLTSDDAPLLAAALLDPIGADACRADANADGQLDGRDVRFFLAALFH